MFLMLLLLGYGVSLTTLGDIWNNKIFKYAQKYNHWIKLSIIKYFDEKEQFKKELWLNSMKGFRLLRVRIGLIRVTIW